MVTARTRTTVVVADARACRGRRRRRASPPPRAASQPASRPKGPTLRAGNPPLSLDLGVRVDREARDLREALRLYEAGKKAEAGALFARHDSLEARIGQAVSRWPEDTVARLTQLSGLHPKSAAVQLNLGIARYWAGENGAKEAWRSAAELEPDTAYAVTAGNLLHPEFARNLPLFVPVANLPPAVEQARRRRPSSRLWSVAPGTASIEIASSTASHCSDSGGSSLRSACSPSAARLDPTNPEARVAAAVGLFDKARPVKAFSRLGPLSRTFPKAATVRFHLGLLLLWSGQVKEARRQLELVSKVEPDSRLVGIAKQYLAQLRAAGI